MSSNSLCHLTHTTLNRFYESRRRRTCKRHANHRELSSHTDQPKKAQFSMYVLTAAAMCFIKCSIACLYKRVFLGSTFARIVNSVIGILVTWAVLFIFGIIFGCGTDFQSTFPSPGRVSCRAYYRMGIVAFSLDIALDLLLAILPLPMVSANCLRN